jgi:hypothetical protein
MKIYIYIPFMSTGDIYLEGIETFKTRGEADYHAELIGYPHFEIVESTLN